MGERKHKILIGPLNERILGAIPTINKVFIDGLSEKYDFIPFNMERAYGKTEKSSLNLKNIYFFFKHFVSWILYLIKYKFNLVHYSITSYWNLEKSLIFLTTAKIFKAKTVGHLHGGAFDSFWDNISSTKKIFALIQFKKLDVLIVTSKYWENYVRCNIDVKKMVIINNPIDLKYEKGVSRKIESTDGKRNGEILFVGSIGKRKGVYDIIETAKFLNIKNIIKIIGSEEKPNDLKNIYRLIEKNNLSKKIKVIESEKLELKQKIDVFSESEIFLFPSYKENFPLVVIEAAAAGLPIITTRVGALPEFFVHQKSVIFVEPGNINQIANAVIELLENKEKRVILGRNAKEVFQNKMGRERIIESLD